MKVRILPSARRRLLEIWDYTARTWGTEQADRYLNGLEKHLSGLLDDRTKWRVPMAGIPGVRFSQYEHHYVFFRELGSCDIGVITILHERMDLPRRFREDNP